MRRSQHEVRLILDPSQDMSDAEGSDSDENQHGMINKCKIMTKYIVILK